MNLKGFFFIIFIFGSSGVSWRRVFLLLSLLSSALSSLPLFFSRKKNDDEPRTRRLGRSWRPGGPRRGRGGEGGGGSSLFVRDGRAVRRREVWEGTKKKVSSTLTISFVFFSCSALSSSSSSSPPSICPSPPRRNRPSPRSSRWSERSPCSSRPQSRSKEEEPPEEGGRPTPVRLFSIETGEGENSSHQEIEKQLVLLLSFSSFSGLSLPR